ncbi:MAG: 4Fe-4S binding protein [Acidobacteria bacterium]|nr:4Fe-4S binding protein [Acidobacteriota bacterium]
MDIKVSWCKGCGLCVDFCNREVLVMEGALPRVVHAERCTRCLLCEAACPDFALDVRDEAPAAAPSREAAP